VITVKVQGLKECEAALNEMTNATARNVLKRALFKACEPVEKAAEARAPVAQGQLRSDITISTQLTKTQRKQNPKASAVEVYVGVGGKRGSFAHLVEFGSAHNAPVGFMRQAIDANTGNVIEIFRRELNIEIEKAKERARRKAARLLAKGR
jgi:HK97 gp10 family phage protein